MISLLCEQLFFYQENEFVKVPIGASYNKQHSKPENAPGFNTPQDAILRSSFGLKK